MVVAFVNDASLQEYAGDRQIATGSMVASGRCSAEDFVFHDSENPFLGNAECSSAFLAENITF